jgi:DNA-binding winged helix-turn-helix (wHTH) protein/tetratricopeptide (TPR) repeat protein
MLLRFGDFELDTAGAELRGVDGVVPIEPKALALLTLLAENGDRVIGRDEMIDVVWQGRIVSDAAVATALKLVRKALGDDGSAQRFVRTVHGIGHRFVPDVRIVAASLPGETPAQDGRPVLAVLPFRFLGAPEPWAALPEAIAAEVIVSLARLRWLRVIARESTFRLRALVIDHRSLLEVLGAGYTLSGVVETLGGRLAVSLELADTRSGSTIWADRFSGELDLAIPMNEAELARLRPTASLDAWENYHLGLAHAYRFTGRENAIAAGYFHRATQLDAQFAQAWAGLSFTNFQDASHGYVHDRQAAALKARRAAERSVEIDTLEPAANFAMGRIGILAGAPDEGAEWLDRAVALAPSYAKAHYARGMVAVLAGRTAAGREAVDRALGLSPLDPLRGPMLGFRAMSLAAEGRLAEALQPAQEASRAARRHVVNLMVSAAIIAMNGRWDEARDLAVIAREIRPDAHFGIVRSALPVADPGFSGQLQSALQALGFPA